MFLDRDGVINEVQLRNGRPYPPDSFEDLKIFKDVLILKKLKTLGFQLIVVTNQPDVGQDSEKGNRGVYQRLSFKRTQYRRFLCLLAWI